MESCKIKWHNKKDSKRNSWYNVSDQTYLHASPLLNVFLSTFLLYHSNTILSRNNGKFNADLILIAQLFNEKSANVH